MLVNKITQLGLLRRCPDHPAESGWKEWVWQREGLRGGTRGGGTRGGGNIVTKTNGDEGQAMLLAAGTERTRTM